MLDRTEEYYIAQGLIKSLEHLPGSIIGWNEEMGVYNLSLVGTAGTNIESKITAISKEKFELDKSESENYMRFSFVSFHLKHLMGEVLTTVEASISDERQLNAVKSIIKSYFGRKLDLIYENCGVPEEEQDYLMSIEE